MAVDTLYAYGPVQESARAPRSRHVLRQIRSLISQMDRDRRVQAESLVRIVDAEAKTRHEMVEIHRILRNMESG